MNNSTFHKIGLIFALAIVSVVTGCGTAATQAASPEFATIANLPDMLPPSGDVTRDTVRHTKTFTTVPRHRQVEEHSSNPTPSFSARNQGSCGWFLRATGDEFSSKEEALDYAKKAKLSDRRVDEKCDFYRIEVIASR